MYSYYTSPIHRYKMSIRTSISQLSDDQKQMILADLQIENPGTHQWIHPYHIDEETMEIFLPYDYATLLQFRPKQKSLYPKESFDFTGTLRPYQKEVKKQVIERLNANGNCLLSLHVGWGKSILAVNLACKLSFKTLIIVNRLVLMKQWKELIEKVCPSSKLQIVKTNQAFKEDCSFYLINAQNVCKMGEGYFKDIGTLVVDECHLICAQSLFKSMYYVEPRYLIGLSATPHRPDGLDALIALYFGKEKIVKALYRPHTVYMVPTKLKLEYSYTWDGKMDWNSVLQSQAEHPKRNQLILNILQKFQDRNFLVLCKRISQGEELVRRLQEKNEHVTDLLGTKKDFDEHARIVIATTQKCGVGFSHDKLDALLLASDVEEYFIQYLGRVFRTPEVEPIIFDLVDDLPVLQRHYASRKKVYKQSGGTFKTLELTFL